MPMLAAVKTSFSMEREGVGRWKSFRFVMSYFYIGEESLLCMEHGTAAWEPCMQLMERIEGNQSLGRGEAGQLMEMREAAKNCRTTIAMEGRREGREEVERTGYLVTKRKTN